MKRNSQRRNNLEGNCIHFQRLTLQTGIDCQHQYSASWQNWEVTSKCALISDLLCRNLQSSSIFSSRQSLPFLVSRCSSLSSCVHLFHSLWHAVFQVWLQLRLIPAAVMLRFLAVLQLACVFIKSCKWQAAFPIEKDIQIQKNTFYNSPFTRYLHVLTNWYSLRRLKASLIPESRHSALSAGTYNWNMAGSTGIPALFSKAIKNIPCFSFSVYCQGIPSLSRASTRTLQP